MKQSLFFVLMLLVFESIIALCSGTPEDGHFPFCIRNCTGYTDHQLKTFNLVFSLAAMIALLTVGSIFLVILYYKAYRTLLQRLFLYLVISKGIQLAVLSTAIMNYFHYSGDGVLCKYLGFINQYTTNLSSVLNVVIALKLFAIVFKYLIRNGTSQLSESKSSKLVKSTVFVFVTLFPLSSIWIPFLAAGYSFDGFDGFSCWVKSYDVNCTYVGNKAQLIFVSLAVANDAITIAVALMLAVIYCAYAYKKHRNPQLITLLRKTLLLMLFIVIRGIGGMLVYSNSQTHSVKYARILMPFAKLAIPVGYLIYLFTNNSNRECCHCVCIKPSRDTERQQLVTSNNNLTNPTSTRVSAPSITQTLPLEHTGIGLTTDANDDR